jgi:hypothetical protein
MAWEFRVALASLEPSPLGFRDGEEEPSAAEPDPFAAAREAGAKVRAM